MTTPFLEPEADDLATVAEALAFIDAYEGSTSGSDSVASPVGPDPNSASGVEVSDSVDSVRGETVDGQQKPKPRRKRRSKNPAGYSTKLLHRKKAEMQQLREQALQLEAKVAQLKLTRAVGVGALAAHASQLKEKAECRWIELAQIELQRRQRSEHTNRKLKALLANQVKVDDALRAVVMKRSVLEQGMEFLFEKSPTVQSSLDAVDNSAVIMAELEKKASEMYLGSRVLFEKESSISTISCEMRRRVDKQLGQMVEIISNAPLSCSMEVACSSLWKELMTMRTYPDKSYRYMQTSTPNVMEKSFDQILRGKAGATPINGLQVMKKFEETDRIVLARAYRMLPATDGLHLRGKVWTIFSRSEADPAETCEVRSFIQLYMETQPGFSPTPEDVAYLRDVAFETWSMKMRTHAQYLQEVMVEAAAGAPAGASQLLLKSIC